MGQTAHAGVVGPEISHMETPLDGNVKPFMKLYFVTYM
jgi:hypothetical protein